MHRRIHSKVSNSKWNRIILSHNRNPFVVNFIVVMCCSVMFPLVICVAMKACASYVHLVCISQFDKLEGLGCLVCMEEILPYLVMLFLWDTLSELDIYYGLNKTDSIFVI